MAKIVFSQSHSVIKKWAVPEIFGKGNISEAIRAQSKLAKKMIKIPLPCTNPVFAFNYRTKYEKCPSNLIFDRINLELKDGGVIGIDQITNDSEEYVNKPIILVFPGGNENTYSTKIQTLCASYLNAGYSKVFMCNYRGKCNTPFTTPQFTLPYGRFNDIAEIVEYISCKYADHQILLTGDCTGGFCIVDYLTSDAAMKDDAVVGGVTHSVQWNAKLANQVLLTEPHFSLFVKPFAKMTKHQLLGGKKGSERFSEMIYEKIGDEKFNEFKCLTMEQPADVRILYENVMGPLYGDYSFMNVDDYVEKTSPHKKVGNLHKPLVVINSADDPISPLAAEDITNIEADPNMCLWLFAGGGHCAYVKTMFPVTNYIDDVIVDCSDILTRSMQD